jgi:hypothetical protein
MSMCLKSRIAGLALGALIVLVSDAPAQAGGNPKKFGGTITSETVPGTTVVDGAISSSLRTLTGDLAPFGEASGYIVQNVNETNLQFYGFFILSNQHGMVFGYLTGQLVPTDATFTSFHVYENVYLTGGTGKFEGISGSGTGVGLALSTGTSTEYESGTYTQGR